MRDRRWKPSKMRGLSRQVVSPNPRRRITADDRSPVYPFQHPRGRGRKCRTCGAPHEGQRAVDVFTDKELNSASGLCEDCGWPYWDNR